MNLLRHSDCLTFYMKMKTKLSLSLFMAVLGCFASVQAEELVVEYQARLSAFDHYSSSDQKLGSVAAIIRQDRANYHKYKVRDEDDQGESFFSSPGNRELLEKWVNEIPMSESDQKVIITGTPLITLRVYSSTETGQKYVLLDFEGKGEYR